MSDKYHLAALNRAVMFEELYRTTKRKLDAAERKLEKERRRYWKKAYKLGYMRSKESEWEANFKLAMEYRKQLEIPTKDREYWIRQAKHYMTEAWLARTFTSISSLP